MLHLVQKTLSLCILSAAIIFIIITKQPPMGNFLRALQRAHEVQIEQFFTGNSLSKVREYYGQFKAISETYCIDNEQFAELFGKHEDVFECFDTDNNLLIDGLELFSGLIVLSRNITFPDKVTFLFELFDFNDLKSLSKTDIEFLFISACTAVQKIYQMEGLQDDSYVQQFVREEFPSEDRVNISEILKWAMRSETVAAFFELLRQEVEREERSTFADKVYLKLSKPKNEGHLTSSYHYIKQEQFMQDTQKLFRFPQEQTELDMKDHDINPSVAWVYGIRYRDVRQFVEYCDDGQELLIYFVGKVIVIYNVRSKKQIHYLGHKNQIISLARRGQLCATSEYAHNPQIRVWNYKTLQTVQILKGYHIQGVHLMKFLDNGLLVTCGSLQQSPIIIFHIQSGEPIFSTSCTSPAIQISLLANFTNRVAEQFMVCSLYELYHFECVKGSEDRQVITMNKMALDEYKRRQQKITTCCFFMINSRFKHLRQYDERVEKHVMSGHENGVINVWNLAKTELQYTFSQEDNEIIRLIPTHNHLLAITNSSFISYYSIDIQEKQKLKVIDITQIDEQLNSYDICECVINQNQRKLLIVTQKADIFFLNELQCIDVPSISHFTHQKYRTQKVQHLLLIFGQIKMQKLLKKDHNEYLYIAVGHTIKAIDIQDHSFIRQWNIGREIVSFDVIHSNVHGLFIIAATIENKLYLFSNKSESTSKVKVDSEILSVMAHAQDSPSVIIVLVSTKESIIKYNIVKNSFSNAYPLNRPNFCPQISPLQGNKVMLSAQNNQLFALIIKEMHIQTLANTNYRTPSPLLKLSYHIPMDNRRIHLPVIVGCQAKALIAGRQDGRITFWNNYEQLLNHNFVCLDAHTSPIADLCYSHDQKHIFSSGSEDEMIIQWRLRYLNEVGSATIYKMREEIPSQSLNDQFSQRRVQFCKFKNDKLVKNYDQHISIRGIKNDIIRRLFKSNIGQWYIQNKILRLEQSSLHLKINFVFGIETFNQNGSVIALSNPKRFLYFISKIIVIYYPAQNQQYFYRGHQFKVTSMVLLQDRVRVASGESAYRPSVHIWSTKTLETLRIIKTSHRWGIIQLATNQNILLTFGLRQIKYEEEVPSQQNQDARYDKNMYSYNVMDYEKGLILATRQEKDLVHSLAINPNDPYKFAVCNDGRVTFWQVRFNIIVKRNVCWLGGDTPTSCTYYRPPKGEPDLLVGTSSGTLGMINRQRYWTMFKKGEKEAKRINCILVVRRDPQTLIIVASEDNIIKIYNQRLQEKFRQSMLKIEPIEQGTKKVRESKGDRQDRNCSIQSLSIISESQGRSNRDVKEQLRILLGTRNGQILQLIQSKEARYGGNKGMSFKAIIFLRFNTSQDVRRVRNKVLITHHPNQQIIATIGLDQQIIFWDTEHNKLLHVTELNTDSDKKYPTAIKFSRSGEYLIIGFSDGELMFFQSKMSKSTKTDEKYCTLNLGKAKKEKDEDGQAVLNIQLSENGEYIAVSYQKIVGQKSYSYIKISHFRIKDKVKNNKNQYEKILDNTSILPCPHLQKSFHTQSGLLFGFAAYSLSFAMIENTSKQYFLSYYQMVDQNQNRLSINIQKGEERNYNIWEVSDSIYPVTSPLIQSIRWRKFYIHNAIQTNYIFHDTPLTINHLEDAPPSNNNLDLSEFTNMTILDKTILTTSFNGDIHIFKLGTLEGAEDGMIGKTLPAHCCKINQIQQFHNQNRSVIYTTGENDECIIKWSVERFEGLAENEDYAQEDRDLFGQVPDHQEMMGKIELYKKKSDVERIILRNENFIQLFKIRQIFGRRAEQVRNNLKYNKYDSIIYSSGHAVVIFHPENNTKQFIYVKEDPIHCLQEVTALQTSKGGEYLISCHAGVRSGVMLWQLNSKILLKRFYLKQIVQILYVIISQDNQRIVLYGLTPELVGQLVMIDVQNEQIMGVVTYSHKKAWQIKSLCFRPNSHDKFFSCGIENIKQWQMMSGQLVNIMSYQNEETIINTCIDFIGQSLVVTNDHGELVIWYNCEEIVKKEEHQNMITCLDVSQEGLIATGSLSSEEELAQVIIWSFLANQLTVIQKISIRLQIIPSPIQSNKGDFGKSQKEADIQSLHLNRNPKNHKVLIGVTKGDIYEYSFESALKKQKSEIKESSEAKPAILASFEDEQKIKAMFFNNDQTQLFEISQHGLLRIWSFMKPELQWCHNFDAPTVNMVYSSQNSLVIIAFRESLRFFKYCPSDQKPLIEIQQNRQKINSITHLVLGPSEKFIALGIQKNSNKQNVIDLFEISAKQFKQKLHLQVDSPILFIDFSHFSKEKSYMFVNTVARPELFDLVLTLNINNQQISQINWMNKGLQFSSKVKRTKTLHEENFRDSIITRIIEIGNDYIFLDYYAGVYLYRNEKLSANCHLNISTIDTVAISQSKKWLAVGSKVDRNIILIQLSQLIDDDI